MSMKICLILYTWKWAQSKYSHTFHYYWLFYHQQEQKKKGKKAVSQRQQLMQNDKPFTFMSDTGKKSVIKDLMENAASNSHSEYTFSDVLSNVH